MQPLLDQENTGSEGPEIRIVLGMIVTDTDGDIRLIGLDIRSGKTVTTDKIADLDLTEGVVRTVFGLRYLLVCDQQRQKTLQNVIRAPWKDA